MLLPSLLCSSVCLPGAKGSWIPQGTCSWSALKGGGLPTNSIKLQPSRFNPLCEISSLHPFQPSCRTLVKPTLKSPVLSLVLDHLLSPDLPGLGALRSHGHMPSSTHITLFAVVAVDPSRPPQALPQPPGHAGRSLWSREWVMSSPYSSLLQRKEAAGVCPRVQTQLGLL